MSDPHSTPAHGSEVPSRSHRPEELIYRSIYAPVDVAEMLGSAESRALIRRLPVTHLFYGLQSLEEKQIEQLLPHVSEAQWQGVLDLDLWKKDRVDSARFLFWQRHIGAAHGAIGRKLARAAGPELWELVFKRLVRVRRRDDPDSDSGQLPGESFLETPDGGYFILLPKHPEANRILRGLVLKLYELDPESVRVWLEESLSRTSIELEEEAYRSRRSRLEDKGFQDYFDAIEVYAPRAAADQLPEKDWEIRSDISALPAMLPRMTQGRYLLFQAFERIEPGGASVLLEELFFVCNKILSADRISPADPSHVKSGIRKALSGINLGLDCWSQGNLRLATEGIQLHYLQSFFQIGYGQLLELRERAHGRMLQPEPGSLDEAAIEGFRRHYPMRTVLSSDRRIRRRFFRSRRDLDKASRILARLES